MNERGSTKMSARTNNTQTTNHTLNLIIEAWKSMFPEIPTLFTLGLTSQNIK